MRGKLMLKVLCLLFLLFPAASLGGENSKCLSNCHGEESIGGGDSSAFSPSLYVDGEKFGLSVHSLAGLGCEDCHPIGGGGGSHPNFGVKEGACRSCHQNKAAGWEKTAHGMAAAMGESSAPYCIDCHTAHYVSAKSHSDSPVNPVGISQLCLSCHQDLYDSGNFGVETVRWRLKGHAKGDLSENYDPSRCLSCHQGEGAHGEENLTGQSCYKCHLAGEKEQNGEGFHFQLGREATFLPSAMTFLYPAGVAAILIMILCEAGALYLNRRRRKKGTRK